MDDLTYSSLVTIADAIRAREVSSSEVLEAHLARIDEVNGDLNAVVQLCAERAREEAAAADAAIARGDELGPLHGVPITLKDSHDTAGVISTGGTLGRKDFVPEADSTVTARLRGAGAILMGKTNTPELTLSGETDNLVYGQTRNPFDLTRTPGGSSGGAGAIICAGGSPLDMGSDTGGSIRLPSHFSGIAGIKPTAGRVPRTGHIVPWGMGALDAWTTIGPMARYVEDLVLALPIISGPDGVDPAIFPVPLGDPADVDISSLRIAYYSDVDGYQRATDDTQATLSAAVTALAELVQSVEQDAPPPISKYVDLWARVGGGDGRAWVDRMLEKWGTTEISPSSSRASREPSPPPPPSTPRRSKPRTSSAARCSAGSRTTTPSSRPSPRSPRPPTARPTRATTAPCSTPAPTTSPAGPARWCAAEPRPRACQSASRFSPSRGARTSAWPSPPPSNPPSAAGGARRCDRLSRLTWQAAEKNRCAGVLCSPPALRGEMPKAEGGPRPRLSRVVVPGQTGPGPPSVTP